MKSSNIINKRAKLLTILLTSVVFALLLYPPVPKKVAQAKDPAQQFSLEAYLNNPNVKKCNYNKILVVNNNKDKPSNPPGGYKYKKQIGAKLHVYERPQGAIQALTTVSLQSFNNNNPDSVAMPDCVVAQSQFFTFPDDPNDPGFASYQWHLRNTQQAGGTVDVDIDAPKAWAAGTGTGVIVAILDTGVQYDHPDLADNMWINAAEDINSDGVYTAADINSVDEDSNGYVDDVIGWDFGDSDNDPVDNNGHGTHVAGIVAATMNNSAGGVGVAPGALVAAVKIFDINGDAWTSGIAEAIDYSVTIGASISNNSYGGGGTPGDAIDVAIDNALAADQLFVAAAGNIPTLGCLDNDLVPVYPATYDAGNIVSVAATDSAGNLASYSCYGATTVDVGAPGTTIYSTYPTDAYATSSGTSMASPVTAGAAAVIRSYCTGCTYLQTKNTLLYSSVASSTLAGKTVTGGIINIANALNLNNFSYLRSLMLPSFPASLSFTITGTPFTSIALPSPSKVTIQKVTGDFQEIYNQTTGQ